MANKKLMLRINFFFLRNRFFLMYESIFEVGVWLDYRDRDWGCVCVCLLHMAGEGSPLLMDCHDDHWVLFSSLSKLHLHP